MPEGGAQKRRVLRTIVWTPELKERLVAMREGMPPMMFKDIARQFKCTTNAAKACYYSIRDGRRSIEYLPYAATPWGAEEDALLLNLRTRRPPVDYEFIAGQLNRPYSHCVRRALEIGARIQRRKTLGFEANFETCVKLGLTLEQTANRLGVKPQQIAGEYYDKKALFRPKENDPQGQGNGGLSNGGHVRQAETGRERHTGS